MCCIFVARTRLLPLAAPIAAATQFHVAAAVYQIRVAAAIAVGANYAHKRANAARSCRRCVALETRKKRKPVQKRAADGGGVLLRVT